MFLWVPSAYRSESNTGMHLFGTCRIVVGFCMCNRLSFSARARDECYDVCMRMHFRQRVAWLLLAFYLISTAGVLYYMFEINTRLRMFALDHVDRLHTIAASPLRPPTPHTKEPIVETSPSVIVSCILFLWSTLSHIVDIPVPVLAVLGFIVYVQVCCLLLLLLY